MRHLPAWLVLLVLLATGLALAEPPAPGETPTPTAVPRTGPLPVEGAAPTSSPAASPAPSPAPLVFDLPPLVRPEWGENWWEEPFLFEMASSAKLTGEQRARRVMERLQTVVDRAVKAGEVIPPAVVVDQSAGVTVVRCGPEVLVTVLPEDLPEYYAQLAPERQKMVARQVAERWVDILEPELKIRVAVWTSEYRWGNMAIAAGLLVLAILLNAALDWFARRYMGTPLWSLRAVLWLTWLIILLTVVPELHWVQWILFGTLLRPLWLLITAGLGAALVFQVARAFLRLYLKRLGRHGKASARHDQQMVSIEGAACFALRLALSLAGLFYVVSGLGLKASHLLAGAGLVGAALTLVSQDLIRDVISGVFILLEDQFVVGDWIQVGTMEGTVEAFNLRGTRIRSMDGTATALPNSELRVVKNHSLEWSQVDYQVAVSLSADAERALQVLVQEAEALATEHPDKVLGQPEVLGIEAMNPAGVTLRVVIRTQPLVQWNFKRELNRRVHARFRAEGIDLAGRRQVVRFEEPLPPAGSEGLGNPEGGYGVPTHGQAP